MHRVRRAGASAGAALALAWLAAWLLAACTPIDRYKLKTIFFTGVPPYGSVPVEEDEAQAAAPTLQRSQRRGGVVVVAGRYSHGPYANNACFECHETSGSGGLRGFGRQEAAQGAIAAAGAISGKLRAPMGELCAECHPSHSPAAAAEAGLWVHGPVSSGYCVVCHGGHSALAAPLLHQPGDQLCAGCHTEAHGGEAARAEQAACGSCHNAHFGKDNRLLTADYREPW